jgi:hypothetical protein
MTTSWTAIASVTIGSATSEINFTSIPATYTDLVIKTSLRSDRGGGNEAYVNVRFNGATTNQTVRRLEGSGGSVYSSNEANNWSFMIAGASQTANTFGNTDIYIPNYAGSSNKPFSVDSVEETNATTAYMSMVAGLWSDTAAINAVKLIIFDGSFVQYSTATLFGIKNS